MSSWGNTAENTAALRKVMDSMYADNPDLVVIPGTCNDFAMTGNRFTKTTKRMTPGGWIGKITYGHINKRGRPVTHRVEHIRVKE
jgi:hypothetical protein